MLFLIKSESFVHRWRKVGETAGSSAGTKLRTVQMADAKVFERAALEADTLAKELAAVKKENYKLRDEIERYSPSRHFFQSNHARRCCADRTSWCNLSGRNVRLRRRQHH